MFRRKYRDVEALILEDVQFFAGKKSTLTEVKHTLDNLIRTGKQVVLTADRSLNELQALGPDLTGRIRGGLTSPVFPLDAEIRRRFLEREFAESNLRIHDSVVSELSQRVTGDGRVLSGIVKRLTAVSSLYSEPLSWEQSWTAVYDLIQSTRSVVRIADIEKVVCDLCGLEPNSLKSQSKMRRVSAPRMLAIIE